MAKYRITSIPQAKKGKIVKSDNTPMVEVQGVQQPSYWNESLPGYMKGEGCPPGKYDFNGECLTETEYIAASNAEMNKEQADYDTKNLARKIDFVKQINDIRASSNDEHAQWQADDTNRYLETFAKSKKQDKIEPYKKFPESEVTPELEAEFKNNFLVHKKDGFVELFPKNIVQDRIITNGFQADQFKNYWGLDPEQVKEQLGDLMGAAKANYEAEVTQNILTKAIEQGKPVDQVIKGLSPKLGQQSNLKATFEKPTNKIIDDAFSELYNNIDSIPGSDASKVEQDRKIFLESSDPMDAWERKYHSGPNNLGDFLTYQSKKIERGDKAYSDWMDKYGKSGQYDGLTFAKDDAMANVRNTNMLRNQTLNQKNALAAANTAKAEDYTKAVGEYVSNLGMDTTKQVLKQALDAAGSNSKTKLQILKSFHEDPNDAMQKLLGQKTGNKKQTYNDVLNDRVDTLFTLNQNRDTMKQGTGINENTTGSKIRDVLRHPFDAAYFAMNPRKQMWGLSNKSYDNRVDAEKKFGVDMGLMPNDNPLAIVRDYTLLQAANPFKIGSNLRKGYDKGEFLSAVGDELFDIGTKRGIMKGTNALLSGQGLKQGLQAFNSPLFNAGFMAKLPENISGAYDNFQQGNYGSAALDALEGAWGAAPLIRGIKPTVGTLQTLNSLRTPGTVAVNSLPSRFTGMYNAATPGSGLVLGNPNITGAKPIYESITNPLNKASKRLGLGEFSVLEQNPKGYLGTGNYPLLGYSDGGLVKGRTGLIVKGLQALGKNPINVGRMANIATIGTANSLVKSIAPIMINPVQLPGSPNVDFSKYLTQEEAIAARAERLISQKNKPGWNEQLTPELEQRLSTAVERHNPASDYPGEKLGSNTMGRTATEVSKDANLSGIPLNEANKARIAAHETGHYYSNSSAEGAEWLKPFNLNKLESYKTKTYLRGKNRSTNYANEIRERAAQLKDYIAQKNGIPLNQDFKITQVQLDDAIKNYVKDTGLDNTMSKMLGALNDKKGLLKTMNKYALGTVPVIIGAETLQQKKQGGTSNNYVELDLTPEEIKDLIAQGYVIEEHN